MIRSYGSHSPRIHPAAFVHDSAEIIGRVSLGQDASIWPLAVLRADVDEIRVGKETNIQDLTVIHCEKGSPAVIGDGVTVGHRVVIHGSRIGDGCLIGMGSVVMEATIGRESFIGAGALVLASLLVPPRSLVLGSPARVVRPLTASELRQLARSAANYRGYARRHARGSRVVFLPAPGVPGAGGAPGERPPPLRTGSGRP